MSRKQANHKLFALTALIILSILPITSLASNEMPAAVEAVKPALIRIKVVSTDYMQGRETKTQSSGSGAIISPEGYAITNHHVTMDAERLVCTLADKREVKATLIGSDALSDIAVIKLENPDNKPLPYASFGDSSTLQVGDRVFAMGSPFSISQSVTMGIVSNTEMIMPEYIGMDGLTLDGEEVGSIVVWIAHDAQIEPGNSGGPLVDKDGKIVGINEISFGLSGAIPGNLAKSVADELIKNGAVSRSWIGVNLQTLLESSDNKKGVLVASVLSDSPAGKAGLQPGDILLSIDGKEFIALFDEQIPIINQFVSEIPVGKTIELNILRDGKEESLSLTTEERKKARDKEDEIRQWGICATNITYLMQKSNKLESQDGVYVISVLPSGPSGAAKPSIDSGDIITKVDGKKVTDLESLKSITFSILDELPEDEKNTPVLVELKRETEELATVVEVGKTDESSGGAEIAKAWMSINSQVITPDLAKAYGLENKRGIRVTQVNDDSEAEKAGLEVGDLIVALDGEDIPAEQVGDEEVFPAMVRQYAIDSEVALTVIRDGEEQTIKVVLESSPKPTRDYPKYRDDNFEFTARDIAFDDRASGDVEKSASGVYVVSVPSGGWASVGGLYSGDVITEIDGKDVGSLEDLKGLLKSYEESRPDVVTFKVKRGIWTRFIEVEPEWPEKI